MNRMNRFQSAVIFITYVASMPCGLPFGNLALTSTVWSSPSSSTRYMVISPVSSVASNTSGSVNTKKAVPLEPSLERVKRTSNTEVSSVRSTN